MSAVASKFSANSAVNSAGDNPISSSAQNVAEESSPALVCSSTVRAKATSSSHPSSVVKVAVVVNV